MQLLRMFHAFLEPIQWQKGSARSLRLFMASLVLAVAVPVSACSQGNSDSRSDRRAIAQSQAIASDFLQTELALSPETATRLEMETRLGPAASFALDNHSQAGFERRRLVRIELLQRLRQRPRLPDEHVLIEDLAIAERALLDLISLEQLGYGRFNYQSMRPYAIDAYSGIWIEGPSLLAFRQSINTAEQAKAFLTRLQSLSAALHDVRRRVVADHTAGIRIPALLSTETQKQLRKIAAPSNGALSEVSAAFDALTLDVPDLEPDQREALVRLVDQEIEQNLRPAYIELATTLVEAADDSAERLGVWAQPRGEELFVGILSSSTGEVIAIDRLHERHLQQVAAWRAKVQNQLKAVPIEDGEVLEQPETLAEQFTWFTAQFPEPEAPETATSATDIAALPEHPLAELAPKSVWATIEATPSFEAQSQAARVLQVLWETVPYMTWQQSAQSEQHALRTLLEYQGIAEAWRIYVWTTQTGNNDQDLLPIDQLARDSFGLVQASLAVIDTGVHLERWNFDESVAYLETNTGLDESVSRQLVLEVVARPAHQSAIMVALQRLEALSERAKAVLGARYSELEFQQTVIQDGPRPLDLIEKDVEAWYGARLAN